MGSADSKQDKSNDDAIPSNINDVGTSESTQVKSKRLRQYIIKHIVQPTYVSDLVDTLKWRYRWRKIGNILYIISKILTAIGGVLAFSETYFKVTYLALSSGIVTLLAVLVLQFGDFAHKESKKKTHETNDILKMLDISGIPEIDESKTNDKGTDNNEESDNNKKIVSDGTTDINKGTDNGKGTDNDKGIDDKIKSINDTTTGGAIIIDVAN